MDEREMYNILVTGGEGYIGRNLIKALGREVNDVTSYDIKSGLDIRDKHNLDRYMDSQEVCFHLAAISGFAECEVDPILTVDTNITGTFNVLQAARKHGTRVVFASSISTKNPTRLYAISKRAAEEQVILSNQIACRLSNVYGGIGYLESKNSVIAKFIRDDIITIDGDGQQKRDFIHVDDVVNGLLTAARILPGKVVDVCSGKYTTISQLAILIDGMMKGKTITHDRYKETRDTPPTNNIFKTTVSLKDGLEREIISWR